jgi:hypothetical protein
MDRTLFTPPMIETFRSCRKAYEFAFNDRQEVERMKLSNLCKRFLLKALAEINRTRLTNVQQVQKFLGQHWPADRLNSDVNSATQEKNVQAFRFVYRVLCNYIAHPYKPELSETAAVNLKVRARVPHSKVYLEDTFDLILWHPHTKHLEFVDYHLHPLKAFDPAWPSASLLVKQFLAERLRTRWPFEKLSITFCQLLPDGIATTNIELDENVYRLHWPELLKTVEEMKNPAAFDPEHLCRRCQFLSQCLPGGAQEGCSQVQERIYRSA